MMIQYACICHKGLVRSRNQDNLVWEWQYLPMENKGLNSPVICEKPLNDIALFGVFDGMGGEPRGDAAAYIAAKSAAHWQPAGTSEDLKELLLESNRKICEFASQNMLQCCGTTAALLLLSGRQSVSCNLGDSKVFLFRNNRLTQLSEDHVLPLARNGKPPLLQFLGIPETEMIIEPAMTEEILQCGDQYLICSDGLTDMLTVDRITDCLCAPMRLDAKAESLLEGALSAGGRDNISAILIRVSE